MAERNSGIDELEVTATPDIVNDLNLKILDKIPSYKRTRTLTFGLGIDHRIQIICTDISLVRTHENSTASDRLIDLEAGTLAAYANLYLMTRGYQVRYIFTNTPDSQNIRLVLTLALYPR